MRGSLDSSLRWSDGVVCTPLFILRGGVAIPTMDSDGGRNPGAALLRKDAPTPTLPRWGRGLCKGLPKTGKEASVMDGAISLR